MFAPVTNRREQLYQALVGRPNEWTTRAQLAELTGKNRLSPNDVHHLTEMEQAGLIEVRTVPSAGVRDQHEYRVKGGAI